MAGRVETMTVANRLESMTEIYDGLERFATEAGLLETARRKLLLVVEELFTNIVSHGYDGEVDDMISVAVTLRADVLELTLRDRAAAFNVAAAPRRPDEAESLEDRAIGGLGLVLVHEFARSVACDRDGDMNVTAVILPLEDD